MIIAGVMSGTSADGINVALVRMPAKDRMPGARPVLIGHAEFAYPKEVRRAVLAAMNAQRASVAELSRLNFALGELYAEAVLATQKRFRVKAELVGCHGQTIYHQGKAAAYLGRKVAATWQTGEGAIVAARVGVPCVSDFRPADMAAGGKGAPLVPFLDYFFYRDKHVGRIAQNIGGIANLTAIPASATLDEVKAFDTGPGNMVIDAVMSELLGKRYDRDGKVAASGTVSDRVITRVLRMPFFKMRPPKTAGREEFGREFVVKFLKMCGRARKQDVVATATALTARSIVDALRRFVVTRRGGFAELIVSGGGVKNPTLMAMLGKELGSVGLKLRTSDEFGLPSEAKEAIAFAVLAYETWNRRASNVPSATGARRAVVLGKVSFG